MENLEEMAKLAVRQGYLNMRMKGMRARIDAGEPPAPIREELKRCLSESLAIEEKLSVHFRARERVVARPEAGRRRAVKEAAKENARV